MGHIKGGGGSSEVGGRSTKKIHVPGSEAATVRVPGFWNSFPRILADKSSGLGSFFKSMCSRRPPARDEGRTPLPLVFFRMMLLEQGLGGGKGCAYRLW